ncbi:MAG: hypothetical protein QW566_00125 [Candidatus Jordarchaeales archaeon]|nr:hypothetical protein [Candidatus Bathyarchaeota archaeon]
MASRYTQLAEWLEKQKADSVSVSFDELERLLGCPLPGSARKLRVWWSNDASHTQAKYGWLGAGWKVEAVNLEAGVVRFRRVAEPTRTEASFVSTAAEALSRRLGVKLYIGVSVNVKGVRRVFDLASADGSVVVEVMYLTAGKTPAARFPAITEKVWLLEKAEAKTKIVAFGGDAHVPNLWIKRYGSLVSGVRFFYIDEHGEAVELPRGAPEKGVLRGA